MDFSLSALSFLEGRSGRSSDCGVGNLAREAQQQAQREERRGEKTGKLGLLHSATIAEAAPFRQT